MHFPSPIETLARFTGFEDGTGNPRIVIRGARGTLLCRWNGDVLIDFHHKAHGLIWVRDTVGLRTFSPLEALAREAE